jgi:hypothetical protein
MNRFLFAGVMALIPFQAFAQTPDSISTQRAHTVAAVDASLAASPGHEVDMSVGSYTYIEPSAQRISIHATKFGGEYTGTLLLNERRRWFAQGDVRGTTGATTYTGWCSPWLIKPNNASRNGYELDVGDASPCGETGDQDWYVESRALVGKDFIGSKWAVSPYTGVGVRYLSNGTTGTPGFRTENYFYPPFGVTAKTRIAARSVLRFTVEYDRLIRGRQTTRSSKLGGGDVPATATAPAFTIDGFTDTSFVQHSGWALRASAAYQMLNRWSVEPYYVHWSVEASPVNFETATFTVHNVTAQEQLGFYEPFSVTNELGVKFGVRF